MNLTKKIIVVTFSLSICNAFAMDLASLKGPLDQQQGNRDHTPIDRLRRFADTNMKDIRLIRGEQELPLVEADIERACNTVERAISSVQEHDGKFLIDIDGLPGFYISEDENESDDNESEGDQAVSYPIVDPRILNLQRLLTIAHADEIKLWEGTQEVVATTRYKEDTRTLIKNVVSVIVEDEAKNVGIDITKLNQVIGKQPEQQPTLWQKVINPTTLGFGALCIVGTWLATKKLEAAQ